MVYSGTHVTAGRARAVVVATGVAHRGRSHRRPDRARRGTEDAAGAAPGAVRQRRWWSRRSACSCWCCCSGCWRELPLAEVADGGHQPDGVDGARGPAGGDDDRAGGGHAAHGRARRDRPPALGRRDARLDDGDLHRQDRHADEERDDGRAPCGCPDGREIAVSGIGYAPDGELLAGGRRWRHARRRRPGPARTAACRRAVQRRRTCCRPRTSALRGPCSAIRPKARCWCWRSRPASSPARCAAMRRATPRCPSIPTPS